MARTLIVQVVRSRPAIVAIDKHLRPPLADNVPYIVSDRRLLKLDVVAIQVDTPCITARTSLCRLKPVGIDLWCYNNCDLIKQLVSIRARNGEVSHQDHKSFSERPFPSMHVRGQNYYRSP